jgi:hypothetical protein
LFINWINQKMYYVLTILKGEKVKKISWNIKVKNTTVRLNS